MLQQRVIAQQIALLGCAVDRQAAHQFTTAILSFKMQGDDVVAFLRGVEIPFVSARAGLHEFDGRGLTIRPENAAADIHEIEKTAVLAVGLDDDLSLRPHLHRLHIKIRAHRRARHRPNRLAPEFREHRAARPLRCPAPGGISCKHHRTAKARLPMRQHRIEIHLAIRTGIRRNQRQLDVILRVILTAGQHHPTQPRKSTDPLQQITGVIGDLDCEWRIALARFMNQ